MAEHICENCSWFKYGDYCDKLDIETERYDGLGCYYWQQSKDSREEEELENSKESDSSDEGCVMTTACCRYMGLPDDCEQLETLRHFRDSYLKGRKNGNEMIQIYYSEAPHIISAIDSRSDRDDIYSDVFAKINEAVELIKSGHYEKAIAEYSAMLFRLSSLVIS